MYKTQPPKVVFKQHSKFSQFVAPLLAGNSKTWLLGNISSVQRPDAIAATLDILTKQDWIFVVTRIGQKEW